MNSQLRPMIWCLLLISFTLIPVSPGAQTTKVPFPVVDTGQLSCYNNSISITCPKPGKPFYGQDANYQGSQPAYRNNGDGTVADLNTGLTWQKTPGKKVAYRQAKANAATLKLGGHTDWHLPSIKELYSLMDFNGVLGYNARSSRPYIDTKYFDFEYGDTGVERLIDAQYASSTEYVSTTMHGNRTIFGVNFADGRIKGYGYSQVANRGEKKFFVRYVRGPSGYGNNSFRDNGDGTITDQNSGLMWMKNDSSRAMNWKDALAYSQKLNYGGHNDWRLPNAKELQGIVDYSRSPKTTGSAAIAPVFKVTSIKDQAGKLNFPYYWSSTTHLDGPQPGTRAVYLAFGEAQGWMADRRTGQSQLLDVHGAGAQRSDLKTGNPQNFPRGLGPQGDVQRILNYVRCVRNNPQKVNQNTFLSKKSTIIVPSSLIRKTSNRPRNKPVGSQTNPVGGSFQNAGGVNPDQRKSDFVKRLDRDGNGMISAAEFDGPQEHFSVMDRNRDGYINTEEAPTGPPTGQSQGQQNFGASNGQAGPMGASPNNSSGNFETQSPGKTSGSPASSPPGPSAGFSQGTQMNSNGSSEGNHSRQFILRLDRDKDGKVSRSEFDGPKEHFSMFDKNGDGKISVEEAPTRPPGRR